MKITQRKDGGWIRIGVIGNDSTKSSGPDAESWDFFKYASSLVIQGLNIEVTERHDGPDSSRWVGSLNGIQLRFDFDDMIGTTICVSLIEPESAKIVDKITQFLNSH